MGEARFRDFLDLLPEELPQVFAVRMDLEEYPRQTEPAIIRKAAAA
jgi:hypothetical protein